MGDHLITIDMGRKLGCCAPFGGKLGLHLTQCGLGWVLPSYQVASWSFQVFGHNRHGPKSGDCTTFRREPRSPSNTMSPELRPTLVPSGILIHPAIQPQQTWAKIGEAAPLWGELGPHITQCRLGQGLPTYQVASWSIQPFGHNTPTSQTGQTDSKTEQTTVQ